MSFFHYYPYDDFYLSITPLLLLFGISKDNYTFIIPVIISSFIYWNYKNVYTFLIDILFANILLYYVLYNCYKKKINLYIIATLVLLIIYFWLNSFINGRTGERQFIEHIFFRMCYFILFIICEFHIKC